MEESKVDKFFSSWLKEIVKAISLLIIVAIIGYKLFQVDMSKVQVDFPTLLSLILGFFSIGLAALFYFKATDSSNLFYDNIHKFTASTSELLAKIEAGFGERLKNIEDNHHDIKTYMAREKHAIVEDLDDSTEALEEVSGEIGNVNEQKNQIIEDFLKDKGISAEEIDSFKEQLELKDNALSNLNEQMNKDKAKIALLTQELYESDEFFQRGRIKKVDEPRLAELSNRYDRRLRESSYIRLEAPEAIELIKKLVSNSSSKKDFVEKVYNGSLSLRTIAAFSLLQLIPSSKSEFKQSAIDKLSDLYESIKAEKI